MNSKNYFADKKIKVFDSDGHNQDTPEVKNLIAISEGRKYYDVYNGFLKISNPGWIIFDFGEEKEITYFRFLLWDNCGSEKKQPSRRKYNYRVLVAGDEIEREGNKIRRWDVIHDTMYNGSNGWQEFYFESSVRRIKYIKLYLMSNSRDEFTHLVDIQAYRYPTESLYDYVTKFSNPADKYIEIENFAPQIHGLINNRVLINDNKEFECIISTQIYEYVVEKLSIIYQMENPDNSTVTENKELRNVIDEVSQRMSEIYSIDEELQHFQQAIHAPILQEIKNQKRKYKSWSWIAIGFTLLGITLSIVDVVKNWSNP